MKLIDDRRWTIYDSTMKTAFLCAAIALALLLSTNAYAQTPAAAQGATANPLSTWLKGAYTNTRNYIARTADKMPEENYGMRPGTQMEVRTFGQILGHLANLNFMWCAQAKGDKNPGAGRDFEKVTTKAELVKGLNEALTYCDGVYSSLTDTAGAETISITQENGRQSQSLRMGLLIQNHAHNNEHYGNLVTYMRIKNIVPPSSERPER